MKAGLEAYIAQEDRLNAARAACNLSELSLTLGDLDQSLEYVEQSVDLADRSGDDLILIFSRTNLANALHQAARLPEAEAAFQEAEEMQKEWQPNVPLLYSVQGFQYCDLLLGQGKYQEVQSRAAQTIEIAKTLSGSLSLWDIANDYLSLGRAHLLQALQEETDDFTQASEHLNQAVDGLRQAGLQDYIPRGLLALNQAVDGLRQAGLQDYIPRGLLARSELYRVQGEFEKAQHDLDEAMTIAERGEMGLHQADCHLEYARLYSPMGDKEEAREHLTTAIEMIGRMGYHRRDIDVREIEEKL